MTPGSKWACTCADWKFHGVNLYDQRLENKVVLAQAVNLSEPKPEDGAVTWEASSDEDVYVVVVKEEGATRTMCKHILAALWDLGLTPVLVEYQSDDREIRTEVYWTDPIVLEQFDDVRRVIPLERSTK